MPMETTLLISKPFGIDYCPKCHSPFTAFLRGQVQRTPRFLGFLWKRDYCALICYACKAIVGWEHP
jgi:hypothetical protein